MRFIATILLLVVTTLSVAAPVEVRGAWITELPYGSQLVFPISAPVKHTSFLLENPPRLVVDVNKARLHADFGNLALNSPDVRGVRAGVRTAADLRIVVDLPILVHSETYVLKAAEKGHRLVVDLYRNQRPDPASIRPGVPDTAIAAPPPHRPVPVNVSSSISETPVITVQPPIKRAQIKAVRRESVIAIDPGHGGKDSGALGPRNTQEKDVVIQIAKRLQRLVNKELGMRAVLTRNNDSYLRLYERIAIARKHKADLFISIHADACEDCDARGSSVFILSTKGASSAAAHWLAKKENESDLIGGGSLGVVDKALVPVVFDMVHDAVVADSMRLADKVLDNLNDVGDVHKGHVERAGFVVLKAPDIPSILVETAFISNPQEEVKLVSSRHQDKLAQAIMDGIRAYFRRRPPQELRVAETPAASPPALRAELAAASPAPQPPHQAPYVHVIQRGESLSDIAERYRVSLSSLRSANGLDGNRLRMPAGTSLTIPTGDS